MPFFARVRIRGSAPVWATGLILLGMTAVQAADYYVIGSGNDRNVGSESSPWKTISKVNSTRLVAGDRVLFAGGQTFIGNLNFTASETGTASAPIVITSYGAGRATINAGTGRGLMAYNTAGYRISNLNFVGAGRTVSTGEGINFYADVAGNVKFNFIAIDNVDISGFGSHGISIGSYNGTTGFQNVSITYASVHDNGNNGILVFGYEDASLTAYAHTNVYIGHCTAHDNSGISGMGVATGSGIVISNVNGGTIERSVAYNNGKQCTSNGGPVGIWTYVSNNVTIQFNESYANHTSSATDGGGFDIDGGVTNSVLQYNYSHDNDGPGFLFAEYAGARAFSNNAIRFNISQNDARKNGPGAIHVWNGGNGIGNSDIYNNTVFISAPGVGVPSALQVDSPTTGLHIRNNILIATGSVPVLRVAGGQSNIQFQGNAYWSGASPLVLSWAGQNYTSLQEWRSATGQESVSGSPTGFNCDPLLTEMGSGVAINNADQLSSLRAYRLQSASPLIGYGLNLRALFGVAPGTQDFWGSAVPSASGYDVGANAFSQASLVNQAPVVSAGPNLTVTLPASVTLQGTVKDDGLPNPPGSVTTLWQQTTGPATALISNYYVLNPVVSFPLAGSYTFTLTASDSQLQSSSSMTVTVQDPVVPADFALTATPSSMAISNKGPASGVVTISALNGFAGPVVLSASGLPSKGNINISFSPVSVLGSGTAKFTVSVGNHAGTGSYTVLIKGVSGSRVHSATLTLTVR